MDPKAVAAMRSFMQAMQQLDAQYVQLMQRCGVQRIPLYRF